MALRRNRIAETSSRSSTNNVPRSGRPLAKPQTNHRRPRITNRLVPLDTSDSNVTFRVGSSGNSIRRLEFSVERNASLPSCSGTRDTSINTGVPRSTLRITERNSSCFQVILTMRYRSLHFDTVQLTSLFMAQREREATRKRRFLEKREPSLVSNV